MENEISIERIVPNINSNDFEKSKEFYINFLGMNLIMDMEWIITFASYKNPKAQITIVKTESPIDINTNPVFLSIEVSDVDKMYEKAKNLNCEITYPITNEDWGVRRFFVKDPNGSILNLLTHIS